MSLVSKERAILKLISFLDLELSDMNYSVRISCRDINKMLDNNYPVELDISTLIKVVNRVMKAMEDLFTVDADSLSYRMRKERPVIESLICSMNYTINRVINSNGINESLFKNSSKFIDLIKIRDALLYLIYK